MGRGQPDRQGIFEFHSDRPIQGDDCWSETPEYFRQVAWPGYVLNREGLRYLHIYMGSQRKTPKQALKIVFGAWDAKFFAWQKIA